MKIAIKNLERCVEVEKDTVKYALDEFTFVGDNPYELKLAGQGWKSTEFYTTREALKAHDANKGAYGFKAFAAIRNAHCLPDRREKICTAPKVCTVAPGSHGAQMPACGETNKHPGNPDCWKEATKEDCP